MKYKGIWRLNLLKTVYLLLILVGNSEKKGISDIKI